MSELRPPLRFETLFETAFGLARDGKTTKQGMPKNPLQPAVLVDETRGMFYFTPAARIDAESVPRVVRRAGFRRQAARVQG